MKGLEAGIRIRRKTEGLVQSVGGMRISREDREIAGGKYNKAKMEK